jgi:TetR/AcrR family acrAB operon transcriptional repressor
VRASHKVAFREAILDAAADVFGRLGYATARIADVAETAGVATGTVYNYFDNKEAVFAAIVERGRAEMLARLDAAAAGRRGLARLSEVIATLFVTLEEQAAMFAVYVEATGLPCMGVPDSDPGVEAGRTAIMDRLIAALVDAIELREVRDDLAVDDLATFLAGSLHGLLVRWIQRPPPRGSLGVQGERFFELFLRGAAR